MDLQLFPEVIIAWFRSSEKELLRPFPSARILQLRSIKKPPVVCEATGGKKISGTVLLSHSQMYSTIAAGVLNYRVREGNVCFYSAMSTGKKYKERKY